MSIGLLISMQEYGQIAAPIRHFPCN